MSNFGVFFDLDGTLVDSLADICGNLNRVRASLGLEPVADSYLIRWIGKGVENLIQGGFPELPEEGHPELVRRYRAQYLETPFVAGALYPGVRDTLLQLRRNPRVRLGVATNKTTVLAEKTLAHYLPDVPFDIIAGPERVTRQKPAPEHLLEVLKQVGVEPAFACFVGDDPVDRQCADSAGVRFFAAAWGFGAVTAAEGHRLTSFSQLLEKIAPTVAIPPEVTV